MKNKFTSIGIAFRIWAITAAIFTVVVYAVFIGTRFGAEIASFFIASAATFTGSIPAFILLTIFIPFIRRSGVIWPVKLRRLLMLQVAISVGYAFILACANIFLFNFHEPQWYLFIYSTIGFFAALFITSFIAFSILLKQIAFLFAPENSSGRTFRNIIHLIFQHKSQNTDTMETIYDPAELTQQSSSNKILVKGLITGGLILLMLIPTIFISNLVNEREERQKEVVKEVSSKWSSSQTISGPYIVLPYSENSVNSEGKPVVIKNQLVVLANSLNVNGNIFPENRPRSIYKVLLYKTSLSFAGSFKTKWPSDIIIANLDFANAKLCFGLSDFKGIQEEIYINFNGQKLLLTPGLPINDPTTAGLSVPISLIAGEIESGITFNMDVKIKGSEKLHFIPLAANSSFKINSTWPSPSFDGNVLPNERTVNKNGFSSKWNFNQANLPFGTVLKQESFNNSNLAFGVSLVQPADQYNKTMRSVKYAILFIGLTFALFFIVEILQKKPFHPVQYVLVGLALVIFYTLLLSISEYLLFDQAYVIAASATVLLISLYAKGHFQNWKTAGVFASVLASLYGFIYILISLEDTALIVGSIGLFLVLALVMYASRKINWYGDSGMLN